nr:MAG: DNA pilot protein [Microviridae sp.]
MDSLGAAGIEAGGSVISSLVGASSAAANRDWQEKMSDTAHQREVADMKAAGINPLLSVTGGSGASTPTGNVFTPENPFRGLAQTALTRQMNQSIIEKNSADAKLADESARTQITQQNVNSALADKSQADAELSRSQLPEVDNRVINLHNQSLLNSAQAHAVEQENRKRDVVGDLWNMGGKALDDVRQGATNLWDIIKQTPQSSIWGKIAKEGTKWLSNDTK